ncbi:MAG: PHP domain-containing protein [Pseudomonadota bacterium]
METVISQSPGGTTGRVGNSARTVIDLHSHSTASDGTLTPAQLVAKAAACGVAVLALTDHDTTSGLEEACAAAVGSPLVLIKGIEISVTWNYHTVHIVGLNIDPGHGALQQGLARLIEFRAWRAQEIGARLEKKAGIAGAYAGAQAYAKGALVSRTHFARFLLDRGHVRTMQDAFDRYLKRSRPAYVPGQWAGLEEAVSWINQSGGQAVIAHPARYPFTATKLRELLGAFKECGGAGIEVVSGSHSRDDYFVMANLARRFGLAASAGSDYHGPENPWLELGVLPELPAGCVPVWQSWNIPGVIPAVPGRP